jgi:hypothetical protein
MLFDLLFDGELFDRGGMLAEAGWRRGGERLVWNHNTQRT